jgi:hypothetical protein
MRDSIRSMQALLDDAEGNVASRERFLRTEDASRCEFCNFRKVCWPEWPKREAE